MAKTYLDQIVEYPSKVMLRIAQSKECAGLLVNKAFDTVSEDDFDNVLDNFIKDYQYIDETTQTVGAYVWVEAEVDRVENKAIKGMKLYVTIACHKNYMKLDKPTFKGVIGNRRDNLVRYIDKVLNGSMFMGIGILKLQSVRTLSPINGFAVREITYEVPDFNLVEINE